MELGCTVLLLDSEKAEEIYTYTYPNKDGTLGKDVHSSALLLLGMKDLIFQVTNNEIYLASFNGLRAIYAVAGPHYVLVLVHSPNAPFQFLHPNFARDLVRCVEFQIGPDWASQVSSSPVEMHRTLDTILEAGISRFVVQGTNYTWVEVVGGGVSEGVFMGEASEAQLCEAVANMEVGCTTKQHLVCVDIEGIGIIGTCVFSGTQQIYTTLSSGLARQVWEWLCIQQNVPTLQTPVTTTPIVMPTASSLAIPPTPSSLLSPPILQSSPSPTTRDTDTTLTSATSYASTSTNNSSPASPRTPLFERTATHAEWQKITQVYPVKPTLTPRYPHTHTLAALAQEEFVVCVLIQSVGTAGWLGNDLRGSIVVDEMRGLLHSLRAAGTLTRIRKQLSSQSPQMFPTDLPYLVTTSPDVTLFHFVAHNQITGVVVHHIAPTTLSVATPTTPNTTSPLEMLFAKTCDKIRKTMISNGAHEHGVKVNIGDDQYWIVGRTSLQGTFFVCYSAQAPQSVVEMAFKSQFFSNLHL